MSIINKIYWSCVCALAGGVMLFTADKLLDKRRHRKENLPAGIESIIKTEQRKKSTVGKRKMKKRNPPVFVGYENPELQRYDSIIIEAVDFWNDFFKDEKNYKEPPLGLIKRILLVETAYKGTHVDEFYTDPMQVGKDFAYKVITQTGGEGLFPEGGVPALRGKLLDERISIYCGVGWIIHKAAKYSYDAKEGKRHIKSMDYSRAVRRYKGGGDPDYEKKVSSLETR